MTAVSTLQELISRAQAAVAELDGSADLLELERWAVCVHQSMSAGGRSFHSVDHVFEIADDPSPLQFLAAMFHDTVYFQVDGGLPDKLHDLLGDAFRVGPGGTLELVLGDDPWKRRLGVLFGFTDGQAVGPFSGINEFTSALLAVRLLQSALNPATCLRVAACIEATIPFRPVVDGRCATERLRARLQTLVDAEGLEVDVEATLHEAVALANRDVGNFAWEDTASFLDNTWQLLPEANAELRIRVYSIDGYHQAMAKMRGFFGSLDPSRVFRSYHGRPDAEALASLTAAAARNIAIGHAYLGAKLLAASLLQALARETGGDAPISLFMGDLPSIRSTSPRLDRLLPQIEACATVDPTVLHLLVVGRARERGFDLINAPLAGYLYACVGENTDALLDTYAAQGPRALLRALPEQAVRQVVEGCAELATTRRGALLALLEE